MKRAVKRSAISAELKKSCCCCNLHCTGSKSSATVLRAIKARLEHGILDVILMRMDQSQNAQCVPGVAALIGLVSSSRAV
mmetsp:Transcript_8845/g.18810  ORF Transcript_8845/g.18810 Transcript_8845/m.18810 type:complete len:80 (-) Transcript_8845:186-425(-)